MKTKNLVLTILLGISLVTITCCKKASDDSTVNIFEKKGLVKDYGDPAVDGCGWIIEIDSTDYKPINLDENFKIDSLHVVVAYMLNNSKASCGFQINAFNEIKIVKIETDTKVTMKERANPNATQRTD